MAELTQDTSIEALSTKRRVKFVRVLLAITLLAELATYYFLTLSRYTGQHIEPIFLRFTTNSDRISLVVFLVVCLFLLRSMIFTSKISLSRSITVMILSLASMWLSVGLANLDVAEFPREASIFYLFLRTLFISVLLSSRGKANTDYSSFTRITRNAFGLLIIVILITFIFTFTYSVTTDFKELKQYDANAAVVLGAAVWHGNELGNRPSPTLDARVKIGADLIKQKVVPSIVVTGSSAPHEKSEAEIAGAALQKLEVGSSVITSESNSRSSLEQVIYIREELRDKQGWKRFIIISDQYHLARVLEMCSFNGISAIGTPSRITQGFTDILFYRLRESVALLAYWMLGK
ncbi:MAG TPA: YdcF family protein [Candidatus Kapabacteria bacterium]